MKLVSVETPEKSVCKMTFSASPEELEAASNAVYERTRASYTIRGFKKGEADRAQIEADRGEHTFWYDAINDLMDKDVPALYDAAMAEHGFVAVDNPVYDLVSVKKDEGFVATATVALQPELNLTKTTGFTAECVTPEVTDKEIDNVLERRRAAAAELVPHKGPAVKGNIVHIDYEGLLEGKPFQGGTAKNQAVQLGSGRMIPGFEEGILGHKAGEEFEIFVTFPNRYHAKDLAGKPVVFKIKLIDVCVRQIPALNSDFAKKVANVDTMDELRAQVKQQLHDGKHAGALNRAKDQILTQLADASEGELPSVLVETTYQQQEFEDFYERIVASSTVKGLLRKDVLVLAISEDDKTSFFDGQDTYNAEFEIDESYEGNVLDVYMKNGKIFKINRLGDTQITLQNVWVESVTDGKCTFLYGNLEKTYPARTEEDIPDGAVTVATSLDADRQTEAGYETAGYVANLVFDYAGICKIERPQKVLRGKVISTGDTDIQVENIGGLTLGDYYKMYNVYEDAVDEESLSLLLGYS